LSQLDFACRVILGENAEEMFVLCLKRKLVMIQWRSGLAEPTEHPPTAHLQKKRSRDPSQRPDYARLLLSLCYTARSS